MARVPDWISKLAPDRYQGIVIRCIRRAAGLRQVHVAKMLGCCQAKVSKLEDGESVLSALHWLTFCRKMEIDPRILLDRVERVRAGKLLVILEEKPPKSERTTGGRPAVSALESKVRFKRAA